MARKRSRIEQLTLNDFTGGFTAKKAATAFTERQWAKLEGFVLEDEATLRSQWGLQQVTGSTDLLWTEFYRGRGASFLVSLTSAGTLQWLPAPSSFDVAATTKALTWTSLATGLPTDLRPLCRIPLKDESAEGYRSALLLNSIDLAGATENAYAIYQTDGSSTLTLVTYSDHWPNYAPDGETPLSNTMPLGQIGAMWGDFLFLADIEWFDDASLDLSAANVKRYRNGFWRSQAQDPTAFDPLDVFFVGDPEFVVNGMVVIDAGLLVFASGGPANVGGVYLLRGTPDRFEIELIRGGEAATGAATFWPYTGTATWIGASGIWHTNGEQVSRLDFPAMGLDTTGDANDRVLTSGPYLLATRLGTMFCARAFEDDAAWTQLVIPGVELLWPSPVGQSIYMTIGILDGATSGQLWRFNRYEPDDGTSERGKQDGTSLALTIATRTLADLDGHATSFFHRYGVRGTTPNDAGGTVVSGRFYAGPARESGVASLSETLNEALTGRFEKVLIATGPLLEGSVEFVFNGDVEVEQISVWAHRGRGSR
ncbi:MAG: hypothetical protein ACRDUY_08795 [Nitriliruptorales bacterium]